MPPKISGGRVGYGDNGRVAGGGQAATITPRQKGDQRVQEPMRKSGGLAGTQQARAQKPVKGISDSNTVSASVSEKVARHTAVNK